MEWNETKWNENDYHCDRSGTRTRGTGTAALPTSLAASILAAQRKPVNCSMFARCRLRAGQFTGRLAEQLPDGGLAVGFAISAPMLSRAVSDNSGPQTCYVRGDARRLPFGDETFDAACCFGRAVPDA